MLFTDFYKTRVHGCMHTHPHHPHHAPPSPPVLFPVEHELGKVPALFFLKELI